jgi:hypothetical protein
MHKYFKYSIVNMIFSHPWAHLPNSTIEKVLIQLTRKSNLSIDSSVSKPMHNLILNSIREGQKHINVNIFSLYQAISRCILIEHMIIEGRTLYYHNLARYHTYQNIVLMIDVGKLGHINYLYILIANILFSGPPLIYKAIRHFSGTME